MALGQYGVLTVAVTAAIDRVSYPCISPPFPTKIRQFNKYLKVVAEQEPHILYWWHARMVRAENILHRDGVHLSHVGNNKLYKSFRTLLMSISKRLSHA